MKALKIGSIIFIVALAVSMIWAWVNIYIIGLYYMKATIFLNVVVGSLPILIIIGAYYAIKEITTAI